MPDRKGRSQLRLNPSLAAFLPDIMRVLLPLVTPTTNFYILYLWTRWPISGRYVEISYSCTDLPSHCHFTRTRCMITRRHHVAKSPACTLSVIPRSRTEYGIQGTRPRRARFTGQLSLQSAGGGTYLFIPAAQIGYSHGTSLKRHGKRLPSVAST